MVHVKHILKQFDQDAFVSAAPKIMMASIKIEFVAFVPVFPSRSMRNASNAAELVQLI